MRILVMLCALVAAESAKLQTYVPPNPQPPPNENIVNTDLLPFDTRDSGDFLENQHSSDINNAHFSTGDGQISSTVSKTPASTISTSIDSENTVGSQGISLPQTFSEQAPSTSEVQQHNTASEFSSQPFAGPTEQVSSQAFPATLVRSYSLPVEQPVVRSGNTQAEESVVQQPESSQADSVQLVENFVSNSSVPSTIDDSTHLAPTSFGNFNAGISSQEHDSFFSVDNGQVLPSTQSQFTSTLPQTSQSVFIDTTPALAGSNAQDASSFTSSSGQITDEPVVQQFTDTPGQFEAQSFLSKNDESSSQQTSFIDSSFSNISLGLERPGSASFSSSHEHTDAAPGSQFSSQPFSADQQDIFANENFGSSPCPEGQVQHVDGRCVTPEVTRNIYLYAAPKQDAIPASLRQNIPPPRVEHNIVFIRTPNQANAQEPVIVPPPSLKNVIYILSKKSEFGPQRVIEVTTPKPRTPEVYFVNYAEGDNPTLPDGSDFQTALRSAVHGQGQVIRGDGNIATERHSTNIAAEGTTSNIAINENLIQGQEAEVSFSAGSVVTNTGDSNLGDFNAPPTSDFGTVQDTNVQNIIEQHTNAFDTSSNFRNNDINNDVSAVLAGTGEGHNENFNIIRSESDEGSLRASGITFAIQEDLGSQSSSGFDLEVRGQTDTINGASDVGVTLPRGEEVQQPSTIYNTP